MNLEIVDGKPTTTNYTDCNRNSIRCSMSISEHFILISECRLPYVQRTWQSHHPHKGNVSHLQNSNFYLFILLLLPLRMNPTRQTTPFRCLFLSLSLSPTHLFSTIYFISSSGPARIVSIKSVSDDWLHSREIYRTQISMIFSHKVLRCKFSCFRFLIFELERLTPPPPPPPPLMSLSPLFTLCNAHVLIIFFMAAEKAM